MNEETFVKGMTLLREAFPGRLMNVKIYKEALNDLTDDEFIKSVERIIKNRTELYPDTNLIALLRESISGKTCDLAQLAWATARSAVVSHGYYKTVSFEDRTINGAIQALGGWEIFSSMLIEEEPFWQKRFCQLYEAWSKSERHCPEKLIGFFERQNGIEEKIVYIGNDKKPKSIESVSGCHVGVIKK